MKAITEDYLRLELRNTQPEIYYIPTGKLLTPAAVNTCSRGRSKSPKRRTGRQRRRPRIVDTPVPAAQEPAPPRQSPNMWTMKPVRSTWKSRSI